MHIGSVYVVNKVSPYVIIHRNHGVKETGIASYFTFAAVPTRVCSSCAIYGGRHGKYTIGHKDKRKICVSLL